MIYALKGSANIRSFFIRRKRGVKISFRGAIYRCLYGKRGRFGRNGGAERETALVKRRAAWTQRGRLGHNRAGLGKRRAGFGKQGAACITGGALRTQRDGMDKRDGADNKVRHEQNKVRHGQNRKQIFVLSPAFHYLCGETDAGPAGRMPGKFCADTHLRTVCAVFAINLRL